MVVVMKNGHCHYAGFVIYAFVVVVTVVVLISYLEPRYGQKNPLVYVTVTGAIGSLTVMACKGLGVVIKQTLQGDNQLTNWLSWIAARQRRLLHQRPDDLPKQGVGRLQHVCRHADPLRRLHVLRHPRFGDPLQGVGRPSAGRHRRRAVRLLHRRQRHLPAAGVQGHEHLDEQPSASEEGRACAAAVQRKLRQRADGGVRGTRRVGRGARLDDVQERTPLLTVKLGRTPSLQRPVAPTVMHHRVIYLFCGHCICKQFFTQEIRYFSVFVFFPFKM